MTGIFRESNFRMDDFSLRFRELPLSFCGGKIFSAHPRRSRDKAPS